MKIQFFNRKTQIIEEEQVYGQKWIQWLYSPNRSQWLVDTLVKRWVSQVFGAMQNLSTSREKIAPFVKQFQICQEDFPSLDQYKNFNEFFIRPFLSSRRPFPLDKSVMGAFAEARYFGYASHNDETSIPVKGVYLNPQHLLGSGRTHFDLSVFDQGPCLLARLCPVDYHRYHFCDEGEVVDFYRITGEFHSVNPLALSLKGDVFLANERHVTICKTKSFGHIAFIEVGALCVGKIIQSYAEACGAKFYRGQEKGYFLFGGSTVIVLGQKGAWVPSDDILYHTAKGIETYVQLGDHVAELPK